MAGQNKVVCLKTNYTPTTGVKVLDELCSLARTRLEAMLCQVLDHVDDTLFDRAEKAGSNADQAMFFATMRQVRLSRRTVVQAFVRETENAFSRLTRFHPAALREPAAAPRLGYSLELMDETVVEESLAAEAIVSKFRTRCALPLSQLRTRLDSLIAERKVDESNNALDPRQIVDAFVVAIAGFDIEIQPKLIIFKLFEKQALLQLPALYEAANQLLIDADILPTLRGTGEPPAAGARQAPQSAVHSGVGFDHGGEDEQDGATLQLLQQLLAQMRGGELPGAQAMRGAGVSDVVQALSALQQQPRVGNLGTSAAQVLNAEELKALLGGSLRVDSNGLPRRIERSADDTIDVVSMLFDIILDDSRLAPSIKAVIARLQIPVLKVAMLDRSFFNNRQHPARALINELAHAATGWVECENPSADPLYRKMNEAMNRILEGFEEDVALFEHVLQDFRHFLAQEQERTQTVEARTQQAAQGKAKVEDARERVQAEIERRLHGKSVPAVVRQILEGAWFKVLCITCVKNGPQGQTWESQLELMERLIWSVQPKGNPDERQRMLTRMPALLHDLREGLHAVFYNPFEMTRFFNELEAEHIRCLAPATAERSGDAAEPESEVGAAEPGPVSYRADEPSVAAETLPLTEEQHLREECLQHLAGVDLGTWFAFSTGAGRQLRAKLSARLNAGRRLIFVNRAGFKLADKKLEEMAEELSSGRAVILDHNMLFDKALEQVITNLRDLRASQAP